MNLNDQSPVTALQITACVLRIAHSEGLTVFPFSGGFFLYDLPFCRYKALKSPTLFSNFSMTRRTGLPDAFHSLVPNNNFHCQTPLKNAKFDLIGSENCQLAKLVSNRDWLFVAVLQATSCILAILSSYNCLTAYICRRFILTTAFIVHVIFGAV